MTAITFRTRAGGACFLPLPFDPKPVFGRVRAPLVVQVAGHAHAGTIAALGGPACIPLRRSHREAAGLAEGDEVAVTPDTAPRAIALSADPPDDLADDPAAATTAAARAGRDRLSHSHRRAHAAARRPETRARRIAKTVAMLERDP